MFKPWCHLIESSLLWIMSETPHFSLNKVQKMTKNFKISMRYKMSTAYGFHMDFQFWVHLTMLGGFQMLQSPRITKLDLERPEMVQNRIFLFQRLDFEYTQLLPSPVLKNLKFWTFWTPLMAKDQPYQVSFDPLPPLSKLWRHCYYISTITLSTLGSA